MLRLNRFCPILLVCLPFQSCTQEEPFATASQTVQFTFSLDGHRGMELPAGTVVVLSITAPSGDTVLTDHAVGIHPSNNGFITDPISLVTNHYLIEGFMVVHNDVALYVTPKTGSEFSRRVNTPLSYPLSFGDGRVIPLQVVEIKNDTAEKFGYTSFRVRNFSTWKIMAFTRENGVSERTAAWAYLMAPGIAFGSILQPEMNTLAFKGDPQRIYTLQVERSGYLTYITDFRYNDIAGNGNKPFKVVLERLPDENTFRITPGAEGEFTFGLGVRGNGSLIIDWGDGTVETLSFSPDPTAPMADVSYVAPLHEYKLPIPNEISISGDLDRIFLYETISVYVSGLDPRNLSALQTFSVAGVSINGLLDLSSNSELQTISLVEESYAWEIRLPESHKIKNVALGSSSGLSQSVVDMVIANIHKNAVANDITGGTVTIERRLELSAQSAEKIQELVDNYGWQLQGIGPA